MSTLVDAITNIQAKADALSGIKAAPVNPPEDMSQFPFSVCYANIGGVEFRASGFGDYLHTIYCEIHVARIILPKAVAQAMPYIESFVSSVIADPTLGGNVSVVNNIRYTFGRLDWADKQHIGIRFEIDVKIHVS